MLPTGAVRVKFSGVVDSYGGEMQMTHPDYIVAPEDAASIPAFEPIYPLTAGLTNKVLRRLVGAPPAARTPELPASGSIWRSSPAAGLARLARRPRRRHRARRATRRQRAAAGLVGQVPPRL